MNESQKNESVPTIPFARVVCDGNELRYITEVIHSGWLTTAGKCMEFEKRFADMLGARFACAVNSATAALHLACEAAGIGSGDKVFVPTLTFTASAEVVRYLGADPVFLDIEYGTGLVTPEILMDAVEHYRDVKALILVHFGGQAADMDRINAICRQTGLVIIEDAAHAFPTRYNGRLIGGDSRAACFSFYANKTITTGEGGMLVTNDETMHNRAKIMRLHGIDRDIWDRFTARKSSWEYDVVAPGYKYNLPDTAAAIGLAQLEQAEAYRLRRQTCAEYYLRRLKTTKHIDLPILKSSPDDHSWHLFPIVLHSDAPVSRNQLIEKMTEKGIGLSVHYKPLHRMTYYRSRYNLVPENYPNAEKWWGGCVSLPVYPSLTITEQSYICDCLEEFLT